MKKNEAKKVADAIVEDLFTLYPYLESEGKQQAHRLVQQTIDHKIHGGWCKDAVRDIIIAHLRKSP